MPRGAPKKRIMLRLDPKLIAEVRALTGNVTAAIELALRAWIDKQRVGK